MTRSRWYNGSLVSLFLLATPLACVIPKQLGEDSGSTDDDDGGTTDAAVVPVEDAPATMAAARCAAFFACDCSAQFPEIIWDTQAECESAMQEAFDAGFAESRAAGQTYAPACVGEYLAFYETAGCGPTGAASDLAWEEVMNCPFFHGELGAGAACESPMIFLPGGSDCAEGLRCTGFSCEAAKADGEPCNGAALLFQDCAHESFCDPSTAPPRCAPLRAIGAPCDDDERCGHDGFCLDDVCAAKKAPGESCTFALECAYGLCDPDTFTCVEVAASCSPWAIEIQDSCDSGRLAADDFIENNSQCDTVDDCVALSAICYQSATCGSIAVNVDHDPEEWAQITAALSSCEDCGADPCGFPLACIDNRCGFDPG